MISRNIRTIEDVLDEWAVWAGEGSCEAQIQAAEREVLLRANVYLDSPVIEKDMTSHGFPPSLTGAGGLHEILGPSREEVINHEHMLLVFEERSWLLLRWGAVIAAVQTISRAGGVWSMRAEVAGRVYYALAGCFAPSGHPTRSHILQVQDPEDESYRLLTSL